MLLFRTLGSAMLLFAVCALGLNAQTGKDKTDVKEIVGKVKSVDVEKATFTIVLDGKDRTFRVTKDTKFVGPKGGVSDEGLKDERMAAGSEIKVVAAGDNRTARMVTLPLRKKADEKQKDKK